MKKSCVIFDMDGCLVDSERAYVKAWLAAFQEKGIDVEESFINGMVGNGFSQINEAITELTGSEDTMWKLRNRREQIFWLYLDAGKVSLKPGAESIIDFARSAGAKVCVATSTVEEKAARVLKHFGLYDRFDYRVYGNMIAELKPAPDIYLKVLELSESTGGECIAFEDSAYGVQAANAAGIDVVYVPDIGLTASKPYYRKLGTLLEGIEVLKQVL